MPKQQHHVMNRYTKQLETEPLARGLRFFYDTRPGRFFLAWGARQYWQSKLYGLYSLSAWSKNKVQRLIKRHPIDPSEWVIPPGGFSCFNAFFTRKLKPGARPVPKDPSSVLFPADARHWAYPELELTQDFKIKGEQFNLSTLLKDEALAQHYVGGTAIFSRLCPTDYHRFHFPVSGIVQPARAIEGRLHSVHPMSHKTRETCMHRNRRCVTAIHTETLGIVTMIEVGALLVGSIQQTYKPKTYVQKGDEKGFFQFGGSAILTLFERDTLALAPDLLEANQQGYELYALVNDVSGSSIKG